MKVQFIMNQELEDAVIEVHAPKANDEVIRIIQLIEEVVNRQNFVMTHDEEVKRLLMYKNVEAFMSENNAVYAITETTKSRLKMKLYEIEVLARPHHFFRISKSDLINLYLVDYFEPDIGTGYIVVMKMSQNRYRVSPKYFKQIQDYIGGRVYE